MPTPLIGSPWQSSWSGSTSPVLAPTGTGTFAVSVGDVLVVEATSENANRTFNTPTNVAAGAATITWTAKDNVGSGGSAPKAQSWTGAVTGAGNVQISLSKSDAFTLDFGVIVWAFDGTTVSGIGQTRGTVLTSPSTGTPSLAPSAPWTANSFICAVDSDWQALAITGHAYTGPGTASDDNAVNVDGNYSTYAWHHADSGASPGSTAIGMTAPTGQTYALLFVEVLPVSFTVDNSTKPARAGMFTPQLRQDGWF